MMYAEHHYNHVKYQRVPLICSLFVGKLRIYAIYILYIYIYIYIYIHVCVCMCVYVCVCMCVYVCMKIL